MRLRSSRIIEVKKQPLPKEGKERQQEPIYTDEVLYKEELGDPGTPPGQDIESYFPPSPFGRKRYQTSIDRFILPSQGRNLTKEFDDSVRKPTEVVEQKESKRITAYFRAEVLDDPNAADEFVSNTESIQGRTLQPTRDNNNNNNNNNDHFASSSSISSLHSNSNNINSSNNSSFSNPFESIVEISTATTMPTTASIATSAIITPTSTCVNMFESPIASRFQTSPISEAGRRILLSNDYKRRFPSSPIKVLDAPDLHDDFYLNLVDWGHNDCLAVGLGSVVYLWNANTSKVTQLCSLPTSELITSVNWSSVGHYLAIGTKEGRVLLFDAVSLEKIRTWTTHKSRVSSLAWASNILSSGGRDHAIYHHDVRSNEAYFRRLTGHTHEICGLKWNSDGSALASGGNDNNLMIWDSHENIILHRFTQHTAAIKAVSWSPHKRGVLLSGGGTADKTIKQWNTITGNLISSHDTGSQVCNLIWSKKTDEIISSHGYANPLVSESNQVHIWKADKMEKVGTLSGHQSRVLYMSMSYDGSTLVTGAADETLMFWDLFSEDEYLKYEPEEKVVCLR
ncbi:hypothetical protein G6F37_009794 [Rhizopus arrhizus]|nr:hypothetical protein G6F38_008369 [Rhizopus arrhizus]KAG1154060.1 hypothetical protein G6F37_009794 [Rhizopus arrhizus]